MVVERTMDALRNVGDAERRTSLEYVVENEMDNVWENQACCEFNVVVRLHYITLSEYEPKLHAYPLSFSFWFLSPYYVSLLFFFFFFLNFVLCLLSFHLFLLCISLISDAHFIGVFLENGHELRDTRRSRAPQVVRRAELSYLLRRLSKIAKLTISFVLVCSSVRQSAWNNSASTRRIFMKFGISVFFETMSTKFPFH
jgi:hypothetical protein